jgi:BirA family biotin operon repressor/biotin-[acetyl-CoA-carboxylase] ligase
MANVDQAWTALADHGAAVGRNDLAARLLDALVAALADFDRHGFDDFLARWPAFDALADRPVRVIHGNGSEMTGTARGIDGQGRLQLETDDGRRRAIASGEVSVRVR